MLRRVEDLFVPISRRLPARWQALIKAAYVRVLSIGVGELPDPVLSADEMMATQELSVIVPVFNSPIATERCLRSLGRFAGQAEIILVDDGSTDHRARTVVEAFSGRYSWLSRRNSQNNYHSGACRSGALLASRPILCFLNSDTVVTQRSWSLCVQALHHQPVLMAVGPRLSSGFPAQTDRRAALCRQVWSDARVYWYAERLYQHYHRCVPRYIDSAVSGAALFLRKRDWERVGGFDGCRPHYGNDDDLCVKLTAGGGRIGVCDGAYVHHLGGASASPP
jgi:GT2 family glycosyltransferase